MNSANKKSSFLSVISYLFKICVTKFRGVFIAGILLNIVAGLSTASITLFKQMFFDYVGRSVDGDGTASMAVLYGVLMGLAMVLVLFLSGIDDVMSSNLFMKLRCYLYINMNSKAARIEPISFEDSKVLDNINKANKGVEGASQVFNSFLGIAAFTLPYFIFMSVYLANIKPILILCVLFSFVPSFIGQIVRFRYYSTLESGVAPLRRKYEYYERCINDREYAKETRLFGGFWFFRKLYESYLALTCKKMWETSRKTELIELGIRFALLAGYIATIYLMYLYLINGEISVGVFAAVFSSVDQMFDFMEESLNYRVSDITQNMATVRNYMDFLDMPERHGEQTELSAKNVRLENVSFTYPNVLSPSLKNINLTVNEGETIAIVGENGAGKSTLVKLMTGLYLPTEGAVLMDGRDTRDIAPYGIYKNISGVFQRFQKYKMKLGDNITISQTDAPSDDSRISGSLNKTEIDTNATSFPEGLDTMLSREFDGTDLSGGQWQKVAIARGFYRFHNMIILDEPTAAIDPVEETRIYKLFADISHDKTSVIVTHRLGSAKIADRIIVMDGGSIADIGTHDELMARPGVYKNMYEAQAKWYV